jgi:hypothetical protein
MRAGRYVYGDEIAGLRQFVSSLQDYINRYPQYEVLDQQGRLHLNVSATQRAVDQLSRQKLRKLGISDQAPAQFTRRALLIFGSYKTVGNSDSRMTADLKTDPTWPGIHSIYAGGERMFATFWEGHYGTSHKKLFIMIGSDKYEGRAKGGFRIRSGIWKNGDQTSVDATQLNQWIDHMAHFHFDRLERHPEKSRMPGVRSQVSAYDPDDRLYEANQEFVEKFLSESAAPNPAGATRTNIAYVRRKGPTAYELDAFHKAKLEQGRKHKFGKGAGARAHAAYR